MCLIISNVKLPKWSENHKWRTEKRVINKMTLSGVYINKLTLELF